MGDTFGELKSLLEDAYLTRVVERITAIGQAGLLTDSVPESYRRELEVLVSEFTTISSLQAYKEWMDKLWIVIYHMAISEPESFRGHWMHECLMRIHPWGDKSRELAWRHIKRYGILDGANKFKPREDLTSEVLFGLLRIGDIDAFFMIKRLILNESITPSRDVCFWFRYGFLQYYCGNHSYYDYVRFEEKKIGHAWEKLCYEVATTIYGEIIEQPILKNGKRPDILPLSDNVIWEGKRISYAPVLIECKKSELSYSSEGLKKYLPFCDQLQIWVLEQYKIEGELLNGMNRVYGKELADKIRAVDEQISRKIIELEEEASRLSIDARLLYRYSGLSNEAMKSIIALHDFFQPYYNSLDVK